MTHEELLANAREENCKVINNTFTGISLNRLLDKKFIVVCSLWILTTIVFFIQAIEKELK